MSRCKSCGALVTWALTVNGKRMPIEPGDGGLDYDPTSNTVHHQPGGEWMSHFATCNQANEWRRK